jgi:uncharacterized protein (TIGR03032 family)
LIVTDTPFASVHTSSLAELLTALGASVLVTTYQAGKVVVVRAEGGQVNTHLRSFNTPMGVALSGDRLALGTRTAVWEYRDQPAAARKLAPAGRHDALFIPRAAHVTGHIAGHEMEYGAGGELWVVNTRFSCLCTLDREHSFTPRWRPSFVTALDTSDRCHLNGLAMADGGPKYVTALGATDSNTAWRANKATGGVLVDVPSGEIVVRGLSMPHSPRLHGGRLWVCESGAGTLGVVDPNAGKYEAVAAVPGFTRGLDFYGDFALVGLSQVRETALFSGIPITDRLPVSERRCGLWVVDLRTGQTVAFLRFDAGVQEVFAVRVLPGVRFPELLDDPNDTTAAESFVLPDAALREVAQSG